MLDYREYLKQFYLQHGKPVAEDNFQGPNINHYINLSLIMPKQDEGVGYDYFQAITDPYSLLFKYKENNYSTMLKSLPEIFDFSEARIVPVLKKCECISPIRTTTGQFHRLNSMQDILHVNYSHTFKLLTAHNIPMISMTPFLHVGASCMSTLKTSLLNVVHRLKPLSKFFKGV